MATTISYNGVQLVNVQTRRFVEEAVHDESHTDTLYHRFTIRVLAIVHGIVSITAGGPIGPNGATIVVDAIPPEGKSPSATLNQIAIRRALLEDRNPFVMSLDDNILLQANATFGEPNYDVNNGPKPKMCEIVHVAGSNVLRVEWEIEICVINCAANANTQGVLNNRWSMQDNIDQDWYTTRTMRGRLRTVSSQLNPHAFRALCIPALQPNFKRQSINVTSSPDGLTLEYEVVDKQVYASAPLPATTWSGTHVVSTTDGATTVKGLHLTVSGPPAAKKTDLIDLCAQIAIIKLGLLDQTAQPLVNNISLIDHLESNTVELNAEFEFPNRDTYANATYAIGWAINIDRFGTPLSSNDIPDYDPGVSPATPLYGQATTAGLLIAYLQSPCDNDHAVPTGDYSNTQGTISQTADGTPQVTYSQQPLDDDLEIDSNYSNSNQQALYSHYRISSTYGCPQGIVQVPYSQPNADGQTCGFIQVCAPTAWRVVRVEAERIGAAPEFPPAVGGVFPGNEGPVTMVVTDYKVTPEAPNLTADGQTKRYRATAEYTYVFDRPFTAGDSLLAGSLPWMTSTVGSDEFPATAYTPGILQ